MSIKIRIAALALSAAFATEGAFAADRCASREDVDTLRVAAFQQELMVAALTCHEVSAYNHFVVSYRPELQQSDHAMLALFDARDGSDGDAEYNAFKTRLANLAALRSNDDGGFCEQSHEAFEAAYENRGSLAGLVEHEPVSVALPFRDCDAVNEASANPPRPREVTHHSVYPAASETADRSDSRWSEGYGSQGNAPAPDNYDPRGYAPQGYGQQGEGSRFYGPQGHEPDEYDPRGFEPGWSGGWQYSGGGE
jgi:hypothetical protein